MAAWRAANGKEIRLATARKIDSALGTECAYGWDAADLAAGAEE